MVAMKERKSMGKTGGVRREDRNLPINNYFSA
jgi:hypothetical protein